jgi:hypothetical protein
MYTSPDFICGHRFLPELMSVTNFSSVIIIFRDAYTAEITNSGDNRCFGRLAKIST